MEIKIDGNGNLQIKRAGKKWIEQYCPSQSIDEVPMCGDWCPLFGDPDAYKDEDGEMDMLQICNGRYLTGKIIDERGDNESGLDEIAARKAANDKAFAEACAK